MFAKPTAKRNKIKLKDSPTGETNKYNYDLYELADGYDIKVTYTIKNESSTAKKINIGDTPLDEFKEADSVQTNFYAALGYVSHNGLITDQGGLFLETQNKTLG
jgi:hypothetical protein